MQKQTRKQHYVPQFYLRRFQDPTLGKLHEFNRLTGKLAQVLTVNTAHENNFYDIRTDEELVTFEPLLAIFDDLHASKLEVIIDKLGPGYQLNEREVDDLAHFILFQSLRTRAHFDTAQDFSNDFLHSIMSRMAEARHEPLLVRGEVKPEGTKVLLIKRLAELHEDHKLLDGMHNRFWRIYQATGRDKFITSDSPFIVASHIPNHRTAGVLEPHSQILFPLSPDFLIVSSGLKLKGGASKDRLCTSAKPEIVQRVNLLQIQRCVRFAFASSKVALDSLVSLYQSTPALEYIPASSETWNYKNAREFAHQIAGRFVIPAVIPADPSELSFYHEALRDTQRRGTVLEKGGIKFPHPDDPEKGRVFTRPGAFYLSF